MRDVFPLGTFQQNYPFRFMQLFVTSVATRHAIHAAIHGDDCSEHSCVSALERQFERGRWRDESRDE